MKEAQTKIVCTIGPETSSKDKIAQLIRAGMSIARINFSHGERNEHRKVIKGIQEVRKSEGRYVAIALDTRGPEVRISTEDDVYVSTGDVMKFYTKQSGGGICISEIDLSVLKIGRKVFIDDGHLELKTTEVFDGGFECISQNGHLVKSNKSMNFPGMDIGTRYLREDDKEDMEFAVECGVDMIFASFVGSRHDVEDIKRIVGNVPVISKIESSMGMENLNEIACVSDGIMVARGDLGVEVGMGSMFSSQKRIVAAAKKAGKPVICATQMMESMISKEMPTRAETSDIGNAVMDECDCVMLSGETAVGRFPIKAVEAMRMICIDAEEYSRRCREGVGMCELFPYISAIVLWLCRVDQVERFYASWPCVPIVMVSRSLCEVRRFCVYRGIICVMYDELMDVRSIAERLCIEGRLMVVEEKSVRVEDI
ncbi:pyruvate kinase [Ordospora pajunii]|uniref:pyruvate kinase n=1 Tax=Ordospora pajunii TaxID=3039483 RepID=UPI0029527D00|nr:pyruvate kinase [Ordospora pajunii]KAH9410798.1 pyruvate kinase [Ordospora pajunii]